MLLTKSARSFPPAFCTTYKPRTCQLTTWGIPGMCFGKHLLSLCYVQGTVLNARTAQIMRLTHARPLPFAEMYHIQPFCQTLGLPMNLRVIILGRTGFSVEPFIDFNDLRLRTTQSQERHTSLWKLPSLNCSGEIHLPGMAGLFLPTISCVSFGFISLFEKNFPLIFLFIFIC